MRLEFIVFCLTIFGMAHIYTEGKYLKLALQHKKYLKMAGVALVGLFLFYVLKKLSPNKKREFLQMSNEYLKHLPIDKNATSIISPILDFTSNNYFANGAGMAAVAGAGATTLPVGNGRSGGGARNYIASAEISGGQKVKRSVSETRKKFVASRQGWRCKSCNMMLDFTYEIDHVKSLASGGDNSVDNLVALCVGCHKQKTLMDYI